jgi:hypothetical protein
MAVMGGKICSVSGDGLELDHEQPESMMAGFGRCGRLRSVAFYFWSRHPGQRQSITSNEVTGSAK